MSRIITLAALFLSLLIASPALAQGDSSITGSWDPIEEFELRFPIYTTNHQYKTADPSKGPEFWGLELDEVATNEDVVQEIVAYARAHPSLIIKITGMSNREKYRDRTQDEGIRNDQRIAENRAQNAWDHLVDSGVNKNQIFGSDGMLYRVDENGPPMAVVQFMRIPTGGQGEAAYQPIFLGEFSDPPTKAGPGDTYRNAGSQNIMINRAGAGEGPDWQLYVPAGAQGDAGGIGDDAVEGLVVKVVGRYGDYGQTGPKPLLGGSVTGSFGLEVYVSEKYSLMGNFRVGKSIGYLSDQEFPLTMGLDASLHRWFGENFWILAGLGRDAYQVNLETIGFTKQELFGQLGLGGCLGPVLLEGTVQGGMADPFGISCQVALGFYFADGNSRHRAKKSDE